MLVNNARTVSEALHNGLHWLRVSGIRQESRVGDVIVSPNPVLTVYTHPMNRVLFSPMRDANPFFHVMEALWMLAGRNDLPWLVHFNKRFAAYSDDGGQTQPGAYGYRWRNYFGYDQLEEVIAELKRNPQTRRCVLTMWHGGGTVQIGPDLHYLGKSDLVRAIEGTNDAPCNTHAYFDTIDGKLNMTVCCRSNDILWGAYGANAVHFSFLLEYLSTMTGIPMGVYRQFSNNFHLYTNIYSDAELMPLARDVEATDRYLGPGLGLSRVFRVPQVRTIPLVTYPSTFDTELSDFMAWSPGGALELENVFFNAVAIPMRVAWDAHKAKDYNAALDACERIRAEDWRIASIEWMQRRMIKHQQNTQRFTEVIDGAA